MKFFNKRKNARKQWATVISSYRTHNSSEQKLWCQRHTSPGRFYFIDSKWWFEHPQDATVFKLKWG